MTSHYKKILHRGLIMGVMIMVPVFAHAASLFLTPGSGTYTPGANFTVSVKVSSPDTAVNAAEGIITFNPSELTVNSISKAGSIFNLWLQEPVFSNTKGTINFGGVVYNPGFMGSAGSLITISFKTKASGRVSFASGSVLANDGYGTNIVTSLNGGTYNITTTSSPTPKPTASLVVTPKLTQPEVVSVSQPAPVMITVEPNAQESLWQRVLNTSKDFLKRSLATNNMWMLVLLVVLIAGAGELVVQYVPIRKVSSRIKKLIPFVATTSLRRQEATMMNTLGKIYTDMEKELEVLKKIKKHRALSAEEQYLKTKLEQYLKTLRIFTK